MTNTRGRLCSPVKRLGESHAQTYAGVKDSVWAYPKQWYADRIDSLLFAVPTLVYALDVLLPVPSS